MGMSMVFGGVRNGFQSFNSKQATNNAILLALAIMAMLIPSLLFHYEESVMNTQVETLSLGVAGIMIVLYAMGIIFNLRQESRADVPAQVHAAEAAPHWSARTAVIVLSLATIGVAIMSELLVGAVEPVVSALGISEFFLGIILIPIIGNVAEHLVAVQVALQNKMDLSVEISLASSLQIALFVAPVLVFISLLFGNPMTLIFNQFEILSLVAGVLIAALVSADGESNWLEGAELLAVYAILGLAFYLIPG
jgi:Ca2+:H+ antiporter